MVSLHPPPTAHEIDTIRLRAVHKRLHRQQWAGNSINTLIKSAINLPDTASLKSALSSIDTLDSASTAAHATIRTLAHERETLSQEASALRAEIASETATVAQLRQQLEQEKRLAARRDGYDAVASLILKEPAVEASRGVLEGKKKEWEMVERQVDRILRVREEVRKEVALFLKCAGNLQKVAGGVGGVLEGEVEEGEMDVEEG